MEDSPNSTSVPPFLPVWDMSLCLESVQCCFFMVQCGSNGSDDDNNGTTGGLSFLCKDPIVPTNCVEASRTSVCGVEAMGSKEEYVVWALGHH